jgi:hypothetical protein
VCLLFAPRLNFALWRVLCEEREVRALPGECRFSIIGFLSTSVDPACPWLCCGVLSATRAAELPAATDLRAFTATTSCELTQPCMDTRAEFEWFSVATSGLRVFCSVCRAVYLLGFLLALEAYCNSLCLCCYHEAAPMEWWRLNSSCGVCARD